MNQTTAAATSSIDEHSGARNGQSPAGAAEAWVAEFIEGWRAPTGPDAFADHFSRLLHPEIRLVQPQMPTVTGREPFRERFVRPLFTLIPDLRGTVERWAVSEDTAFIELTLSGTLGGRPISWRVCDRISLRDGKAIERESYLDPTPVLLAVLTRPRAWLPFLRARAKDLAARMRTGRPA